MLKSTTSCCGSSVAPSHSVPSYECGLLELWRPRLWSFIRAERVKTRVRVQPCGPLNFPLMPTIRFQSKCSACSCPAAKHHLNEMFIVAATNSKCQTLFFKTVQPELTDEMARYPKKGTYSFCIVSLDTWLTGYGINLQMVWLETRPNLSLDVSYRAAKRQKVWQAADCVSTVFKLITCFKTALTARISFV